MWIHLNSDKDFYKEQNILDDKKGLPHKCEGKSSSGQIHNDFYSSSCWLFSIVSFDLITKVGLSE